MERKDWFVGVTWRKTMVLVILGIALTKQYEKLEMRFFGHK